MTTMLPDLPALSRRSDEQLLGDFAQVLTHRIRNLLAGIEGFTDLLADTLGSQEQRDLALRILESTARIEFVLSDLQHYSQPVHMVKLPMRVQDVVDQVKAALGEKDLPHIHFDIQHAEQPLTADPILLRQALLMLIQNALEALRKDKQVTLRTTLDRKDNTLCFGVWNKGTINFDKVANKLFEPFFTTKPHALGIGLSMAKRIAGAHGGTVYLASNDKVRGTCFTLKIPATSKANVLTPYSD